MSRPVLGWICNPVLLFRARIKIKLVTNKGLNQWFGLQIQTSTQTNTTFLLLNPSPNSQPQRIQLNKPRCIFLIVN